MCAGPSGSHTYKGWVVHTTSTRMLKLEPQHGRTRTHVSLSIPFLVSLSFPSGWCAAARLPRPSPAIPGAAAGWCCSGSLLTIDSTPPPRSCEPQRPLIAPASARRFAAAATPCSDRLRSSTPPPYGAAPPRSPPPVPCRVASFLSGTLLGCGQKWWWCGTALVVCVVADGGTGPGGLALVLPRLPLLWCRRDGALAQPRHRHPCRHCLDYNDSRWASCCDRLVSRWTGCGLWYLGLANALVDLDTMCWMFLMNTSS